MNKEDIIRMAREAGMHYRQIADEFCKADTDGVPLEMLERFAALVAAAEREKVARWQIGSGYATGHGDTIEDLLVDLEWQVREAEREACAKVAEETVCDTHLPTGVKIYGSRAAAAIRARGQA